MGSYISLGIVYQSDQNLKLNLKKLVTLLNTNKAPINYKVSFDDHDSPIEERISYSDFLEHRIDQVGKDNYVSLNFKTAFLGFNHVLLTITIYQKDQYYGFIIDLFEDFFKISYLDIEELITDFISENYQTLKFSYAFVEHDGEIEYSPDEVLSTDPNYSLLFINKGSLQIIKGDHLLDGITTRII